MTRYRRGAQSTSTCAQQPSLRRHDRRARAERDDLADGAGAVAVVVELVSDELLGLDHVRRDDVGLGAHRMAQRVAVGVDDRHHVELAHLAQELGVELGLDAARQRAGEHDDRRAARQVEELLAELLELVGVDRRAPAR